MRVPLVRRSTPYGLSAAVILVYCYLVYLRPWVLGATIALVILLVALQGLVDAHRRSRRTPDVLPQKSERV